MKTSPKDIFLQLFATAMLYLSIIATFITSFALTDWFIKSGADRYPNNIEQLGNMMSFPLAMLTVAFPLFIWSTYVLYKRMKQDKTLLDSRARSWLTNLTLFLAAIIIAVTAIVVVYSFFDGDLTARTLIKSAVVILVSILTIYWYKGGEEKDSVDGAQNIIAIVGVVLFVTILIVGVVTMGSPKERRMMREDREVRYSIQNVYYTIESSLYGNDDVVLPETVDVPEGITYTRTSDTTATLCATFETEYTESDDEYYVGPRPTLIGDKDTGRTITMPDWSHTPGDNCYTIEVK
jgi:hypothetical protein